MFDEYVLQYITDFLKLCKRCNKYDIYNNAKLHFSEIQYVLPGIG